MEVQGKIIAILPKTNGVSQRSGNAWSAQTFVLETTEQYPKKIPFEVFGEDRLAKFNIQMGETVTIHFDVDGREWNGKWFAKVSCYNVTRAGQTPVNTQNSQLPPQQNVATPQPVAPAPQTQPQGGDGLPF